MDRPATPGDVDRICRSLPETELGTSWGDLVEDPSVPFFTIDHFRRTNAVLVQQSRLGDPGG